MSCPCSRTSGGKQAGRSGAKGNCCSFHFKEILSINLNFSGKCFALAFPPHDIEAYGLCWRGDKILVCQAFVLFEVFRASFWVSLLVCPMCVKRDTCIESLQEGTTYLVDRIDEYNNSPLDIAPIPPPFRAIPCRPIVLDLAHSFMDFPPLANRTVKADVKPTGPLSWFWG